MANTEIITGPTGLLMQLNLNEARMLMNYLDRLGGDDSRARAASVYIDGDPEGELDRLLVAITGACRDFFVAAGEHGKAGPRKSTGVRNSVVPRRGHRTGRQA